MEAEGWLCGNLEVMYLETHHSSCHVRQRRGASRLRNQWMEAVAWSGPHWGI